MIRPVGSGADRWGPVPVLVQDLRGHVHDHANLAGRRYPRAVERGRESLIDKLGRIEIREGLVQAAMRTSCERNDQGPARHVAMPTAGT